MDVKFYPSDLTDGQWQLIAPLLPKAKSGGCCRTTSDRGRPFTITSVSIDGMEHGSTFMIASIFKSARRRAVRRLPRRRLLTANRSKRLKKGGPWL